MIFRDILMSADSSVHLFGNFVYPALSLLVISDDDMGTEDLIGVGTFYGIPAYREDSLEFNKF